MAKTQLGVVMIWFAIGGAAQQPSRERPRSEEPQELRAIGCVRRIDTSAMRQGTTSQPKTEKYRGTSSRVVLKFAAIGPDATAEKTRGSSVEYGLQSETAQLDDFINHLVEVKGRLLAAEPVKSANHEAAPQPPRPKTAGGNDILVTTIRSLQSSCDGGAQ